MQMLTKTKLEAEELLLKQISLQTEGYKITTSMALNVLMKAAAENSSIDAVCSGLADVVDANTLRGALNRTLKVEDLQQHEEEFNAALAECIPVGMPRVGLEMAIDFHNALFPLLPIIKEPDRLEHACYNYCNHRRSYL